MSGARAFAQSFPLNDMLVVSSWATLSNRRGNARSERDGAGSPRLACEREPSSVAASAADAPDDHGSSERTSRRERDLKFRPNRLQNAAPFTGSIPFIRLHFTGHGDRRVNVGPMVAHPFRMASRIDEVAAATYVPGPEYAWSSRPPGGVAK